MGLFYRSVLGNCLKKKIPGGYSDARGRIMGGTKKSPAKKE